MAHPYDELVETFPDLGRIAAFARKVGGKEVVDGVLTGDLTVERVGQVLQIKEAVRPLFDKNGRRIPPQGLKAAVCDPNREFHIVQPDINGNALTERLGRLSRHFPAGTKFLSADEFGERIRALVGELAVDKRLVNLLKAGVCLPVCLPQFVVADYGQVLDEVFVPATAAAYKEHFSERSFTNYRQGTLASQVMIVPGTRHEQLVARLASSPAAGLYFPNPLQGFSVHAQREQMSSLPESLLLAGGLDTAAAWVMYPDVLARDFKTPGYDCSAVQWQSSEYSLCFLADDDKAFFDCRGLLADASAVCSGGLLFIG